MALPPGRSPNNPKGGILLPSFQIVLSSLCNLEFMKASPDFLSHYLRHRGHEQPGPRVSKNLPQDLERSPNNSPFPHSPVTSNHHSTFCPYDFDYSRYLIKLSISLPIPGSVLPHERSHGHKYVYPSLWATLRPQPMQIAVLRPGLGP